MTRRNLIIVRSSHVPILKEKILPSSSEHVFLSWRPVFRCYTDAAAGRCSLWFIRIISATGICEMDKRDDKDSESRAFLYVCLVICRWELPKLPINFLQHKAMA
ncbi:hypothetical protein AVEN_248138-1 [Araneus ventricosus]|uniref:Uncharacterized protein n=1 Tax=Araneus ventricosus TaxID=182803 RepID=A0A4Y2HWF3_ARAVE|nr:hypothetical protein AVEN_248138-1 [Araneus ventricosus]